VAPVGVATTARIPLTIGAGCRIQANPAGNQFLVPLEVQLDHAEGLRFGDAVYPTPQPYRLQGSDDELDTYQGDIEIVVPITAARSAVAGAIAVEGIVRFQACDSRTCLFPSSIPLKFVVDVAHSQPASRK
jgi:DsbC/DsbD-like thiol-disulfide interchange protein